MTDPKALAERIVSTIKNSRDGWEADVPEIESLLSAALDEVKKSKTIAEQHVELYPPKLLSASALGDIPDNPPFKVVSLPSDKLRQFRNDFAVLLEFAQAVTGRKDVCALDIWNWHRANDDMSVTKLTRPELFIEIRRLYESIKEAKAEAYDEGRRAGLSEAFDHAATIAEKESNAYAGKALLASYACADVAKEIRRRKDEVLK